MKTIFTFVLSTVFQFNIFAQPQQDSIPPEVKALADELVENLNISELLQGSRDDIVEIKRFKSRGYKRGGWYSGLNPKMVPQLSDDEIVDFTVAYNNALLVCFSYFARSLPFDGTHDIDLVSFLPPSCFSLWDYFRDNMKIETRDELSNFMNLVQHTPKSFLLWSKH